MVFGGSAVIFYLSEWLNSYLHSLGRPYLVPSIPAIDNRIPARQHGGEGK